MYLADTNLLSEPRQARPNANVLAWLSAHESEIFISAITIAELQSGISLLAVGRKRQALQHRLDELRGNFRASLLAFDDSVAVRWGHMTAGLARREKR